MACYKVKQIESLKGHIDGFAYYNALSASQMYLILQPITSLNCTSIFTTI